MRVERDTQGGFRQHRPLPSVDLALLPHERRAARVRHMLAGAGVAAVAAGIGLALLFRSLSTQSAKPAATPGAMPKSPNPLARQDPKPALAGPDDAESSPTAAMPEDAYAVASGPSPGRAEGSLEHSVGVRRVQRPFGQARGFRDAVQKLGVVGSEASELVGALRDVVDFRRCRPADRLVAELGSKGRLVSFEYHALPTEFVRATRSNRGELVAEIVRVPVRQVRRLKGSRISGSLGGALEAVGLGRSLAGVFVEVFEGRVDFHKDTREGDSFRLIVNEEHINDDFLRYGTVEALEYVGQRVGTLRAFWYQPDQGTGDFFDAEGRAMHGGWLRTPLRYDHISSEFNLRRMHPILKRIVPHNGVDYAAAPGTPVWAAGEGTVTFAGRRGANGNLVILRHEGGCETLYAHLSRFQRGVRRGARVRQRQPVGTVGSTGRSTGPHLHFGLKCKGRFVDPQKHLNGPGRMMRSSKLTAYRKLVRRLSKELTRISLADAPVSTLGTPRAITPARSGAPARSAAPMD